MTQPPRQTTPTLDRLPPIPAEAMTPIQQQVAAELIAGPRGKIEGPFVPLLRSPQFMSRLQKVGEYLRYDSALPQRLREFLILLVARRWGQRFEWYAHQPLALKAGVPAATAAAIAAGRRPATMTEDEAIVYDFWDELDRNRTVSDASYGRAVARFGEQGVIDLTGLIGYYGTLAMVMNVARTPAPYSGEAALPSLAPDAWPTAG